MRKKFLNYLIITGVFFTLTSSCTKDDDDNIDNENKEESNTFKDSRDGHVYKWVKIGTQIWMAENLAYLPAVYPSTSGSYSALRYYVYGYNGSDVAIAKQQSNYATYGVLYNWQAAKEACPQGWHLPSENEWHTLENYLMLHGFNFDGTITDNMNNKIAKSMAATNNWNTTSFTGAIGDNLSLNNKSGFSALPGGYRLAGNGSFDELGSDGYWWSSTIYNGSHAWGPTLSAFRSDIVWYNNKMEWGFSVRCVRD